MNAIDALFQTLRGAGRKAFVPFLPAGDPDLGFTRDALAALPAAGADLVEVGFPFSDPIADGPVIQASYNRALTNKLKLADLFAAVRDVTGSPGWATPVVGMVSYSLIHKRGPERFVREAAAAGLSGLVVPDLPVEEADEFAAVATGGGVHPILLVTPTTSPARAERIVRACGGFVYVVSVVGITGERAAAMSAVPAMLQRLRGMTDLPLLVGFGVSKPDHVRELKPLADGVIVGTAVVRAMEPAGSPDGRTSALDAVTTVVRTLSAALNG